MFSLYKLAYTKAYTIRKMAFGNCEYQEGEILLLISH